MESASATRTSSITPCAQKDRISKRLSATLRFRNSGLSHFFKEAGLKEKNGTPSSDEVPLWREGVLNQSRKVAHCASDLVHSFRRMHAVVPQFGNAKYLGFRVVLTEVTEFCDKVFEPCTLRSALPLGSSKNHETIGEASGFDDNVVSDVRQLAVTNSTGSSFRICFIDKNIIYVFHIYQEFEN